MELINKTNFNKLKVLKFKNAKKDLSITDIEKQLNFDKVKPIILTDSESKDWTEKGDSFNEWYEEELRNFYKKNSKRS